MMNDEKRQKTEEKKVGCRDAIYRVRKRRTYITRKQKMNKQTSLTKTSEKNGKDSIDSKSDENVSPSISPTGEILQMQQTIGNQAVQELFKSGAIQAKLRTVQPGNQYEQEADRAADCIAQNRDCRENPLSPVEPQIQRVSANNKETEKKPPPPPPTTKTETTKKTDKPLPGLIVEDTVKVLKGQMRKKQFLDQLEDAVCRTVNSVLEGTEYSTDSCPYLQYYLSYYRTKSSQHIERALLRYAPEAAGAKTAQDYINFIIPRAAMATVIWLDTGEVPGIPKGFAAAAPGEGAEGEGTTAGVSAKARAGGLRNADNVQTIQSRLGPGQPLDGGVRSRIGSAFGQDFSHVRIHTDANAAQLSDNLNARAFTIGKDISFAPGEYRPGTLIGDALIAHELAHTIQQRGGSSTAEPMQKGVTENSALEEDADMSAIGAVASTWDGIKAGFTANVLPRIRSGLRLSRCSDKSNKPRRDHQPQRCPQPQGTLKPEDVACEMVGRKFEVTGAFNAGGTKLEPGDIVTVISWDNVSESVIVFGGGTRRQFSIPKTLLKPTRLKVTGVAPYSAGVVSQAAAVRKIKKEFEEWKAKERWYKTNKKFYRKVRKELKETLARKLKILNRKLIQETMFNRFDAIIKKEVDAANSAHGFKGAQALDPNLFKSLIFREGQFGTAGEHFEVPPSHSAKTRFNISQAIDSSGLALMTLFKKEYPSIMKKFLPNMRKNLYKAQREYNRLKRKKALTPTEAVRLRELKALSEQFWEAFIWSYKSPSTSFRFADVVKNFFNKSIPPLNFDYEFWVHLGVMWLFEKHKPGRSWATTIMLYNGTGPEARCYRDAVVGRVKKAVSAAKKGEEFIPKRVKCRERRKRK